jgi:hypothetical protein
MQLRSACAALPSRQWDSAANSTMTNGTVGGVMVSHVRTTTAIGEQAIMADAVEPAGPHVDKGAADELVDGECHHLGPLLLPSAVLWGEGLSPTGLTMQINALRAPVREAAACPTLFPGNRLREVANFSVEWMSQLQRATISPEPKYWRRRE